MYTGFWSLFETNKSFVEVVFSFFCRTITSNTYTQTKETSAHYAATNAPVDEPAKHWWCWPSRRGVWVGATTMVCCLARHASKCKPHGIRQHNLLHILCGRCAANLTKGGRQAGSMFFTLRISIIYIIVSHAHVFMVVKFFILFSPTKTKTKANGDDGASQQPKTQRHRQTGCSDLNFADGTQIALGTQRSSNHARCLEYPKEYPLLLYQQQSSADGGSSMVVPLAFVCCFTPTSYSGF